MFMNTIGPDLDNTKLELFKRNVKEWLELDIIIKEQEKRIKDLKKKRTKELEPLITKFMTENNITDLNTNNGKIKCAERNTKKGFNKNNIRTNLSKFINDQTILDTAIDQIVNNREVVTSYKLKVLKS
jgi:ATPase subunit of ABC transporter with duplicated ATPase domains